MSSNISDFQIPPPDSADKFEELCLDLYKAKFREEAQLNGRTGQAQRGVDIFISHKDIGIQCKKRDLNGKISEKELKDEIEKAKKFKPPLKRFILATTCKRDAKIQESARQISKSHKEKTLFSVEIHSWHEIKELLDKHPSVFNKHHHGFKIFSNADFIRSIQSKSHHQELNGIIDLIKENKPETALNLLKNFEKENQLQDEEIYRVLTIKAYANITLKKHMEAAKLLVKALQFKPKDENANVNCAQAWLIMGNIKETKKYIEKTKKLNPLNQIAHIIEIQVKDREGQTVDKITSNLPKPLKENYKIANVLSHIMIKRGKYKEAEKQLNIFYNKIKEQTQENILDKADWADMFLHLISKRYIFSPYPDNLRAKLKEIIKIYKNLTDTELRKFHPDHHLNYAQALELNGEPDKAIHAFKNGIEYVPNDSHLKTELARLYMAQSRWHDAIHLLEDLPELKVFIALDSNSINKTQQKAQPGYEFLFNLVMMLADAYFQTRQNEKAFKYLGRVIETSFLTEHEKLIFKQFKVFKQINFEEIDKAEKALDLFFEDTKDNVFNLILKSKIEAVKEESIAQRRGKEKSENHKNKKIFYLKKALAVFNEKVQNKTSNNTESRIHEYVRDIEHLYGELFYSQMYQEAEPLLERMTDQNQDQNQNLNHPEIFNLLYIYFENGKNKQAIDLAKDLLKKFPNNPKPANILFNIYANLGDMKTAIQHYENFIQLNPNNYSIKIELACAYLQCGHLEKLKKLLQKPIDISHLNGEQTGQLSYIYMSMGDTKKALETQYRRIESYPHDLKSEADYFKLILSLNQPKSSDFEEGFDVTDFKKRESDNKIFLNPEVVGLDGFVRIRDIKIQEDLEIIIEESAPVYKPEHKLSQALEGKKVGDIILFNDKEYKIIEIKSKYIHKHHEILKEIEIKFPSQTVVKQVYIPKKGNTIDLEKLFNNIPFDRQNPQDHYENFFKPYREGKVPIGSLAKALGEHPIEIMRILFSSQEDKFISSVPLWENSRKTQELLDGKDSILLDLLSLIMIHLIQIEKYVEASRFKLYICPSTINALKRYIEETSLHAKDGRLTMGLNQSGEIRKDFVPANQMKQNLTFWKKVNSWAEKHAQIKHISPDIVLNRKKRQHFEKGIGKEFLDPILALYRDKNTIFMSEDAVLKTYIPSIFKEIERFQTTPVEPSITPARVFDLIDWLEQDVIIDKNQAVQFKAKLVKLNQTYIPIDHNILFALLKEAEYVVSDFRFQRGLFFLGPVSNWGGVAKVTADFLIELSQSLTLGPYRKQLITKEVLDQVSFKRNKSSKEIALQIIRLVQAETHLLPLLQQEVCKAVIHWQKHKIYCSG